tara:strand:- start:106 stop:243 length:138 start_codon:yes stop_codon:yes gene_type:complete
MDLTMLSFDDSNAFCIFLTVSVIKKRKKVKRKKRNVGEMSVKNNL